MPPAAPDALVLFIPAVSQERFAPKFEGDTSAEEWLEAELRATHPRLDKVRRVFFSACTDSQPCAVADASSHFPPLPLRIRCG